MEPITPKEASDLKENFIDPVMIQAVNAILSEQYSSYITFTQKELLKKYRELGGQLSDDELFKKKHLDFEGVFRKKGWKVEYDSPAYCESYEANFKFTPKN